MKLALDEFKKRIELLSQKEAATMRQQYIDKFIQTSNDFYLDNILKTKVCSDGICYDGYLWECLGDYTLIKKHDFYQNYNHLKEVFVFWDIHSKDKIWAENYWLFGKDSMLLLEYNDFSENFYYLPEDLYIFDYSLQWSLILTHEDKDGENICFKCGNFPLVQ